MRAEFLLVVLHVSSIVLFFGSLIIIGIRTKNMKKSQLIKGKVIGNKIHGMNTHYVNKYYPEIEVEYKNSLLTFEATTMLRSSMKFPLDKEFDVYIIKDSKENPKFAVKENYLMRPTAFIILSTVFLLLMISIMYSM